MTDNPPFDPGTQPGDTPRHRRELPQRHVDLILAVLADGRPRRAYRIEDAIELPPGNTARLFATLCALAEEGLLWREDDYSHVDTFRVPPQEAPPAAQEPRQDVSTPPVAYPVTDPLVAFYGPPGPVPDALIGCRFIRLVNQGGIPQPPPTPPESGPNWIATDDPAEVGRWLAGGGNVGLLLKDLVCLDIDPKHALPRTATSSRDANISIADGIAAHLAQRGLPITLTQRTRSGGLHFIFRARPKQVYDEIPWPELRGDGGPLVECRSGAHRWIVLTPSKFRPPLAPMTWLRVAPLADAPEWLPSKPWRHERPELPTVQGLAKARAQAELSAALDFRGQLEADGWTFVRHPRGYWLLVRPGKRPSDGASATLDKVGPGVLHVFSTAAPLPTGNYDAFAYLTAVHYDGDALAALAAFEVPHAG